MFHDVEQSILDRLTAGLAGAQRTDVRIMTHAEIDEAKDARQHAPYVAVHYDGYSLGETIANGRVQKLNLEWYVVIGTKSARGNGKNIAARDAAGDLAAIVLSLLLGFAILKPDGRPSGAYLRLRESPGPEYEGGYCYLPIGFSSPITFTGTP